MKHASESMEKYKVTLLILLFLLAFLVSIDGSKQLPGIFVMKLDFYVHEESTTLVASFASDVPVAPKKWDGAGSTTLEPEAMMVSFVPFLGSMLNFGCCQVISLNLFPLVLNTNNYFLIMGGS